MSLSRASRLAALTMVAFLAFLFAVFGAFLVPTTPITWVSLGVVIAVVGNVGLGALGRRLTGSTSGAVVPAVVWLVVALGLASGQREGDVVLTNEAASLAFLLLGAMAWAVAIGRRPAPRPAVPADDLADDDLAG